MLLTIITRTFGGRPLGISVNRLSVSSQKYSDEIQHLIVTDDQRRGVAWAQENLRTLTPLLTGDYVMLLDDDDFLVGVDLVKELERQVKDSPEVVIVQMNMGDGRILPGDESWGRAPVRSNIPCSSYVVRRDVWNEHVKDFSAKYDGDFDFIDAVWNCGHPFQWWKRIVSRVGRVSHGQAEDGAVIADRVQAG